MWRTVDLRSACTLDLGRADAHRLVADARLSALVTRTVDYQAEPPQTATYDI